MAPRPHDLVFRNVRPEADRRLQKALYDSVQQDIARQEELEIEAEAKQLAAQTLRDEKIKAKADVIAKHKRTVT